jgi:hypothetical protein
MPSIGAAKAKEKSNPAAPPTMIAVTNGKPDKKTAYVNVGGTVQFENRDSTDYRIRIWVKHRRKHPVVDVLLPAVGGVTLMTDPHAKKKDSCEYALLPTNLQIPPQGGVAASGGGGKIVVGPTPPPK